MADCIPTAKNDLRLLDPKRVRLRADAFGTLQLEVGIEERYSPVHLFRCLPLNRPAEFISVQDEEGSEIGIIPDLRELDGESRRIAEGELELYYLKAQVQAIRGVENRNGVITWELATDQGSKTVHVRDRQNIRPLPNGRTMLTDIYDAKYEIPPASELDERSRHWLEIEM